VDAGLVALVRWVNDALASLPPPGEAGADDAGTDGPNAKRARPAPLRALITAEGAEAEGAALRLERGAGTTAVHLARRQGRTGLSKLWLDNRVCGATDGQCRAVAAAPLQPGELVGRLPTSLVITSHVARASAEGRLLAAYEALRAKAGTTVAAASLRRVVPCHSAKRAQAPVGSTAALVADPQWAPFPSRWYLYLFVAAERAKGAASAWAPYLASAPPAFDDPLWFTPAERALLKGTNLDAALALDERQLETLYAATFPGIYEAGLAEAATLFPPGAFSREHVRWARSLYSSRCFPRTTPRMRPAPSRDEWGCT